MSNHVTRRLVNTIGATLKVSPDRIALDAELDSLGINSIILMELLENIEQEFGFTLTPAQVAGVTSLSGLAAVLEDLVGEPATEETSRPDASREMLSYISDKYSVDLSHRRFDSVEEIVEALVSDHSAALLHHYGLQPASANRDEAKPAPARASDIAIVGMSCRLPDAPDVGSFWNNLLEGRNSVREIPASRWHWQEHFSPVPGPGKSVSKWGALLDDVDCFDAGFFGISPEQASAMDPQQRLLLQETYRAVENAGMDIRKLAGTATGVFIGYQYSEYEHHLRAHNNRSLRDGPLFSSSSPSYYLAHRISFQFDFRGPSESINIQCASSAVAINRAYYSLVNGESDVALAGGVSLNLFAGDYVASSQYGLLSANGTSGVFDNEASGFTRGEGVAMIVLKRLEDARRDNDRIYAVIKSCHHGYRGAARSLSEVRHEAFTSVLGECYRKADIDPETVRYVEVDGYATKWADSIEYEGIKNAVTRGTASGKRCALGSVKGNIGNVEAASGVSNVIKVALSLYHKRFPATISKRRLSTFLDVDNPAHPLYVADQAIGFDAIRQDDAPIRAGINSFADSGTNVHILLEEHIESPRAANQMASSKQLCVFSAADASRLDAYVQDYIEFLSSNADADGFAELAYTLQTGREALNQRLAIVAGSREELLEKLRLFKATDARARENLAAKDIYYGAASASRSNPLAGLIGADMVRQQLQDSVKTQQWKPMALFWVNGIAVDWETIWTGKTLRRAELPSYPFAKERYWIDAAPPTTVAPLVTSEIAAVVDDVRASAAWHFATDAVANAVALDRTEKIRLFLQQEIGLQLRRPLDEIALGKTFPDLGMSSVGIAALINSIDRLLQTHLSPSAIFKYPQVETLAAYLAATYPEAIDSLSVSGPVEPRPDNETMSSVELVIPVQPRGTAPALFAVPGAGANALSLQQLSRALGDDQPFYCLEPVGLNGDVAPLASVEALARLHIEGMKSVQGQGPYRLLGYSNGGVVAFEMARQLLQQHERIESLMLLDSLCPTLRHEPIEVMMVAVFKHFVRTLGGVSDLDVKRLQQVPANECSAYLYENIVRLGIELPKEQFLATFDVAAASERACRAYLPTALPEKIDVTLFRAIDGFKDAPEDYGWRPFLSAPPRICSVKADHFSLVERDAVREVARQIHSLTGKAARKVAAGAVREAQSLVG